MVACQKQTVQLVFRDEVGKNCSFKLLIFFMNALSPVLPLFWLLLSVKTRFSCPAMFSSAGMRGSHSVHTLDEPGWTLQSSGFCVTPNHMGEHKHLPQCPRQLRFPWNECSYWFKPNMESNSIWGLRGYFTLPLCGWSIYCICLFHKANTNAENLRNNSKRGLYGHYTLTL